MSSGGVLLYRHPAGAYARQTRQLIEVVTPSSHNEWVSYQLLKFSFDNPGRAGLKRAKQTRKQNKKPRSR